MDCSVLTFISLSQSQGSLIASGQVQMTDLKVLERGEDGQCPSKEERESARLEIHIKLLPQ